MEAIRSIGVARAGRAAAEMPVPSLEAWLEDGRLTLVHPDRGPVPSDSWGDLPVAMRRNALQDFDRVVRANSKAAVLFLRP